MRWRTAAIALADSIGWPNVAMGDVKRNGTPTPENLALVSVVEPLEHFDGGKDSMGNRQRDAFAGAAQEH